MSMRWPYSSVALTSAASIACVLRAGVCGRVALSCATQETTLSKAAATIRPRRRCMQKERPESVKVRPITAIERAADLSAAVRVMCTTADDRTVRLWPCASRVCSHACRAWLSCMTRAATAMAAHGWPHGSRVRVARECPCARVRVARGRCWPAWRPSMWCAHDLWCC